MEDNKEKVENNEVAVSEDNTKKEKEEPKKEKKESSISKWWKKTTGDVKASILETKIENMWNDTHSKCGVFVYGSNMLSNFSIYGIFEDNKLTYFGDEEIPEYSVLIDEKSNKAYYTKGFAKTEVKVTLEGVEYLRPGTVLNLDDKVEEINIIKAGSRYFKYHGDINKK